ncbi:MAG: hypothetical protein H7X89_03675 [Rhizobiales bacterium]|nr:hypothetical protein [Hyphomicrobiales bacterium]
MKELHVSRRGVVAGAAVMAAMSAAGAGWAQTAASGSQPVVLITGTSSGFGRLMAETSRAINCGL